MHRAQLSSCQFFAKWFGAHGEVAHWIERNVCPVLVHRLLLIEPAPSKAAKMRYVKVRGSIPLLYTTIQERA